MSEEYKGEAHYWTEDADGDPVLLDRPKPLTEVHTPEEIRDGIRTSIHDSRGVFVPTGQRAKCPTCESTAPERHPAMQHEGEVQICPNAWHSSTHAGREAMNKAIGHAYAEQRDEEPVERVRLSAEEGGKAIQKWADEAMFTAEPIDATAGPKVHLLWMTADPLAVIAAPSAMYKGDVRRSLRDVTHAERREYIQQIKATKLKAPFEFVKFHFLIEGVTRAFTHQMVRQRTAVYAQESLRFAVKEDMPVALPPSLAGTEEMFSAAEYDRASTEDQNRYDWDWAVQQVGNVYDKLVRKGMPAEDARGLLPHNTLTRLHYCTDLRALLDHAGNRLCTQAQFEWRLVFAKIAEAIRNYNPYAGLLAQLNNMGEGEPKVSADYVQHCAENDRWQYEAISQLFAPVCYQTGKCEFKADFDRKCSIRERVDAYHERGISSEQWADGHYPVGTGQLNIKPIFPAEWLLNPGAAR